jgi:diguanylate cyclase (GGDEF)-like protein/PAS domain S-box-containing protein
MSAPLAFSWLAVPPIRVVVSNARRPLQGPGQLRLSVIVSTVVGCLAALTAIAAVFAQHGTSLLLAPLLVSLFATALGGALSLRLAWRYRQVRGLTENRTSERELPESERVVPEREHEREREHEHEQPDARFAAALAQAPIGMALANLEGDLTQVNRALSSLTGYAPERLLGMRLLELVHPEDRAAEARDLEAISAGRLHSYEAERRYLHAAGHPIWVAVHCTMIPEGVNEPTRVLAYVEDLTSRREDNSQLAHLADRDPLTGLFNRPAFERILEEHVVRGERYGHSGAVMVLDLDHFQQVNDALGHGPGDELLMRVAKVLATTLRKSDAIARIGGDEFAILLPAGQLNEAERVANKLLRALVTERSAGSEGARSTPSASIGVAPLSASVELTSEEALINAGLAMYEAKEAKGNCIKIYDGSMRGQARIEARLDWIKRIRTAIDDDGLTLHVQPVVELASGRTVQHELLVRMVDPEGDLIMPRSFLPIAERFGLMRAIDRWVIANAIALLGDQLAVGSRPTVEVNLSGQSLGDWDLAELIERELLTREIQPSQLIFEITEASAVSNVAHARRFADQLKALGCRFALDDFGSGFGSFYYVKHLPVDFLKISGEFVRNCSRDATDRLVIAAIVELASGLGKQTIAELVGDEQTAQTLRGLGVDLGQGYHLGKPAPLASWLGAPAVQPS